MEILDILDGKRNTFCIWQNYIFLAEAERIQTRQSWDSKRSQIIKTSGRKRTPNLFRALLISMICTTCSKQQRLSMGRAQIATLLSSPRIGHFWRMTLSFNNNEGALRAAHEQRNDGDRRHHSVHSRSPRQTITRYPANPRMKSDMLQCKWKTIKLAAQTASRRKSSSLVARI